MRISDWSSDVCSSDLHPSGAHAPNAYYWLGESYYVTQNYTLAQQQFQALIDRYPTHDKAPGALLKVGLSQYGQQLVTQAEKTLSEVTTRYPGTDAARTAADRLRAIQLSQVRSARQHPRGGARSAPQGDRQEARRGGKEGD